MRASGQRRRRQSPGRRPAALGPAVFGLLLWACSQSAEQALEAPDPLVKLEVPRQDLAVDEERELRSLGYVGDDARLEAQLAPSSQPVAPGRRAASKAKSPAPSEAPADTPDYGTLSELDHRAAQSLNQRANEAFDYLGVGALAAKNSAADKDSSLGDAPDDLFRFRDEATAGTFSATAGAFSERIARGKADGRARELLAESKLRRFANGEGGKRGGLAGSGSPVVDQIGKTARLSRAQQFEHDRRSLANLTYQSASGYWANTYVPGDPVMRWLESRVGRRDRAALQGFASQPLILEAGARQTPQPFDPPSNAALSIFVQADRRGLEGEGRMLVQVGLQGAHRRSGLRPAMNVGIVLDLRGTISSEVGASMRALVDGFLKAKDLGDRFSLTVAGRPGGILVRGDDFRHGPITLAMNRLLEHRGAAERRPALDLDEAVRTTALEQQRNDDPNAPLGSSLVLLVTAQPLGAYTEALASIAHRSAVAGIPVSVVAVGDNVDLAEIERVALAGQGNRRLLHAPAEAEGLVGRELSALARVIARAVRLRIRLAPGTRLVEVVGSGRLDPAGAQRVREAEKSVDRRLARNMGIAQDRGEDEAGIQIVIPTFQSGDAHAVVLDVVSAGPGPIADVTVRYKDLVYLRNGVARANLSLGRSAEPPGLLERNVVKNYLAIRLSGVLKRAGRSLLSGGGQQAIALLREYQVLIEGLQREIPGFQNDFDLANDARMLAEYCALLESGGAGQLESRQHLADSLQLAGYFKTVPRTPSGVGNGRR